MTQPSLKHEDYSVGWICALEIERSAARCMLDKEHLNLPLSDFDQNIYSLGSIGDHNVAIACLPEGMPGTAVAATVANFMSSTFTKLRFQLLVGIGGGAPKSFGDGNPRHDIHLGDIVVSTPTDGHGGVIQYDFGKAEANGEFVHKETLRRPPLILLSAIGKMRSDERLQGLNLSKHLQRFGSFQDTDEWKHQGLESDELFAADYIHKDIKDFLKSCKDCERKYLIPRLTRNDTKPAIHYGLIATANQVMKDGIKREKIRSKHNILCFEMEAGGLDNFECLVIRGICDYSDTHKNDRWQPYAAATAAAYTRELLFKIPKSQVSQKLPIPSEAFAKVPNPVSVIFDARAMCESSDERPQKRARFSNPSDHCAISKDVVDEPSDILEGYEGVRDEFKDIIFEHYGKRQDLACLVNSDVREAMMIECWHPRRMLDITYAEKIEVKTKYTIEQLKWLATLVKPLIEKEGVQTEKCSIKETDPPTMTEDILPVATILKRTSLYMRSIDYGAVVPSELDYDQLPRVEFDGRLVNALQTWALTENSIMNYVELQSDNVRSHEISILALQIIKSASECTPHIPVISFFCEAPRAAYNIELAPGKECDSPIRILEQMSGLAYSLSHQLLEILPTLEDVTRPLKQWYKCSTNDPSGDYDSALELLKIVFSMAPSLLLCIIDSVDAFIDGCEEGPSQLSALVDVLQQAMQNDDKIFKVLFTTRHRVPSLVSLLRPEEMKIISRTRRARLTGGRVPGRRHLRMSFT